MHVTWIVAGMCLAAAAAQPARPAFVPVGVGYHGGRNAAADLKAIKTLGFNTVVLRRGSGGDGLVPLVLGAGLHAMVEAGGAPRFLEPPPGSSADVRLRGWEAVARGERAIFFPRWSGAGGLVDEDGTLTPRARTAGEFAGVITRNASLFAALRPRAAEGARVRVDEGAAGVEGHLLESAAATLIVAINHADRAQSATLRFPPDTPEAIWQNLETGAAVSFVMGPEGPYLGHAFLARDVLVLVRAKRLF